MAFCVLFLCIQFKNNDKLNRNNNINYFLNLHFKNNNKLNRNNNTNYFLNLHFKYVSNYPFALFLITNPMKLVSVTPKSDTISISNVRPIISVFSRIASANFASATFWSSAVQGDNLLLRHFQMQSF